MPIQILIAISLICILTRISHVISVQIACEICKLTMIVMTSLSDSLLVHSFFFSLWLNEQTVSNYPISDGKCSCNVLMISLIQLFMCAIKKTLHCRRDK